MKQAKFIVAGLLAALLPALAPADDSVWIEPATGMEFVRIAAGCYAMGLPAGAFELDSIPLFSRRIERTEMPAHEVCVDEFWLGRHEVTQGQWRQLMGDGKGSLGDEYPMVGVRWQEAVDFSRRLSEKSASAGTFRLPTEAEWEYACRAGNPAQTELLGTNKLAPLAWFSYSYGVNSAERFHTVHPVGTRPANGAGLHDMLGNAWEWTLDHFQADAYRKHPRQNPRVTAASPDRSIRGGSFQSAPHFVRCEARGWQAADLPLDSLGFRLTLIRQGEK